MAEEKVKVTEEKVAEEKPVKKITTGHIKDCLALYMRAKPTIEAESVGIIGEKATFKILNKKDPYFYEVEFEGIVGYCMKKFVEVN